MAGTHTEPPPAVSVRDLTKVYGEEIRAVDGVSFDVAPGTVLGLLGPNGAGKTTTIKAMLGLVLPTAGEVEVAGIDVHADPRAAYRHVGAVLEGARNTYWRLTVRENLAFFASLAGLDPAAQRDRHDRLLEQFDLAGKADTTVNELSRGMKQKVSLVSVLARDTDVVFLDEPTLGLDVESSLELRRELARLVEERDLTVVLSSHDMDVIEDLCDRVIILEDGRVVADDSIAGLVDLFRSQTYRVTVLGGVPAAARADIEATYEVGTWTDAGERTRFEVTLADGNDLHALTGRLVEAGCQLDAVTAVEPDFEEVFLRLTGREEPAAGPTEVDTDVRA